MPTTRQLRDAYRFPGFDPLATVHGLFGDPYAVVVTLQRRGKKRLVGFVDKSRPPFTIKGIAKSGTSPVETSASISHSPFGEYSAAGVAP
jgi:hypothetical protein